MPVKKVEQNGEVCYQWGDNGHIYCGEGAEAKAAAQGAAAHANGFKDSLMALDLMSLTTSRKTTKDGYLIVSGALARTGIQQYRAYELGLKDKEPMAIINLYRPSEEVFQKDSMESFENAPVTIEHPDEAVTADNWANLAKGEVRDVKRVGDYLGANLYVKSKDAIDAIEEGKVQLSNGYTFDLDLTSGVTPDGKAYDGIQRNIRGNHVALVDAARCGPACRLADSINKEDKTMAKRTVIVDGIQVEAEDAAASAIDKLMQDRAALTEKVEKLTADASVACLGATHTAQSLAKVATDQAAEIEKLQKDVMTPAARDAMVADWAGLISTVKTEFPEFVTDGKTCLQIRKEAIGLMTKDNETVKSVVNAMAEDVEAVDADTAKKVFSAALKLRTELKTSTQAGDSSLADAIVGDGNGKQTQPQAVGRDAFMRNLKAGFQQAKTA